MHVTTRRALLAGGGVLAAGTLAMVTLLRKPQPPVILTLAPASPSEPAKLETIAALIRTNPPVPPPDAALVDAQGEVHHLSEFAGKGLVVNLWATWCMPCVAELPSLNALARTLAGDGILVLPLSSDHGGARVVSKFYQAHGIDALPIWTDHNGEVSRAWGVRGIPTTLVIDRRGREVGRLEGGADWASDEAVGEIRKLAGR
jgi:thiol-disulfide isomerase/thioredoxin